MENTKDFYVYFLFLRFYFDKNACFQCQILIHQNVFMKKTFFFSESDLLTCADPQKTVNCTDNWGRKDCGQIKDSKFQNYGCQDVNSHTFDYFVCSNRKDKEEIIFKNPPVPKEKSRQAWNFNEVLNFTDQGFICGQREISWADFRQHQYSNENCLLKNGENMTITQLWGNLMTDYSFKMSPKLTAM